MKSNLPSTYFYDLFFIYRPVWNRIIGSAVCIYVLVWACRKFGGFLYVK